MRTKLTTIRFRVVAPFLLFLFVFALWFPLWQHAPHAYSTRVLGLVFGIMTAVLAALYLVGSFQWHFGWVVEVAVRVYETYFKRESAEAVVRPATKTMRRTDIPALLITKKRRDGTPVRGICPACEVEFSTEAFAGDRTYPHATRLDEWYREHFEAHICDTPE